MAECKSPQEDQVHGKVDSTATGEDRSEVCEQCKVDNNILPAVGWCETCDAALCNGCYEYHCRPKTMRNHRLMYIADKKNIKQRKRVSMKCDKHEGKSLEYFCENHAELGCSPCFVTKHRSCSKIVYIPDVKTKESNEFKTLETILSQFETRLKRNEEIIEDNLGRAKRQHDKAIADIKEAGDKLKAHIDALVKQQILKAKERNEDNIKNMRCVEETQKEMGNKLKSGREIISAEITDNNRLFVTMKSLQPEAHILRTMLDECVKKNTVEEYEFELSSELAEVLEKVKHLGTLKDTQVLNVEKATDEVVDVVEVRRFTQYNSYWSGGGDTTDAIGVSTDHDIRLLHVLVRACVNDDTEVSLTINEGGNCLIRCNSRDKRDVGQPVVALNIVKEGGADGLTLKAGHQYVIDVTRGEGAGIYYYGLDALSTVTEKGVTITFGNTARTNVYLGFIAGLRFTVI